MSYDAVKESIAGLSLFLSPPKRLVLIADYQRRSEECIFATSQTSSFAHIVFLFLGEGWSVGGMGEGRGGSRGRGGGRSILMLNGYTVPLTSYKLSHLS